MDEEIKTANPLGYQKISKLLRSLAIPAIIANLVNALYNVVDQIFIGQGIGYLGNAATNIGFPITTICLIPEFLTTALNVPFYLGGTSLLILVVVTMDFSTQINSYRMTQQYESLMSGLDMKSLSRK